ncbi:MAG TPA: hypothetical protein VMC09_03650 [Anaerolineales bacterium]|nr:hypothetical protein [Anaerolineales bacterium]
MESKPPSGLPMICGRNIDGDPAYFPNAKYQGQAVYFCTQFCLNAFAADPDRFYLAHRKKGTDPEDCDLKEARE